LLFKERRDVKNAYVRNPDRVEGRRDECYGCLSLALYYLECLPAQLSSQVTDGGLFNDTVSTVEVTCLQMIAYGEAESLQVIFHSAPWGL
jgi:hypothetical protein